MKTSVNAAKAAKVRVENILSAECCATKVAVTKAAVTRVAVTKVVATKAVATRVVATRVAATRVVETRVVETTTKAYLTRRPASVQRSKARAYVRAWSFHR